MSQRKQRLEKFTDQILKISMGDQFLWWDLGVRFDPKAPSIFLHLHLGVYLLCLFHIQAEGPSSRVSTILSSLSSSEKNLRSWCISLMVRCTILIVISLQNSKSTRGQIKYLVYCMENAISNLPPGQEQMVWLVDFNGFSMSDISVKSTRETANILQEHYPERLSIAILYDPPKIFEPFWKVSSCTSYYDFLVC